MLARHIRMPYQMINQHCFTIYLRHRRNIRRYDIRLKIADILGLYIDLLNGLLANQGHLIALLVQHFFLFDSVEATLAGGCRRFLVFVAKW